MQTRHFTGKLTTENRIICTWSLIQLVILVMIPALILAGSDSLRGLLLAASLFALLYAMITLAILTLRFRAHPQTREKARLHTELAMLVTRKKSAHMQLAQISDHPNTNEAACWQNHKARHLLASLQHWEDNLATRLQQYDQINLTAFLQAALLPAADVKRVAPGWMARAYANILPVLIVGGLLVEGGTALMSMSMIYLDALPPKTAIETLTPTFPLGPTATLIQTTTTTPAQTKTQTPTSTLTSTETETPTSTAPAMANFDCISPEAARQFGLVTRVVDGDTIDVRINGMIYPVRYIGMDTPERGEPYGYEAAAANSQLVDGQTVILVKDVSEVDPYDRLLRYVFVGDIFVNFELVKSGDAHSSVYPPDTACQAVFEQAQSQAQSAGKGIWAPTPALPPAAKPPAGKNCDPAYPGVCIKPSPPDLDCKDIPYRRFQVLPPDPHHFDGDGDGVGCES